MAKVASSSSLSGCGWVTLLEQLHPLLVLDALRLHRGDGLAARLELLRAEDRPRVVERRLEHRDHVEREGRRLGVEQVEHGERERRERLVEREVRLQVDGQADAHDAVRADALLDHARLAQRAVDAERAARELELPPPRLVVVEDERVHVRVDVAAARDHVQQHRGRDLHVRGERLGLGVDELAEARLAPGDEALRRLLRDPLAPLLRVVAHLVERLAVLRLVLGRLHDHGAGGVVARAARAPGDLVELAGGELAHPGAVVLGQRGEQHRADRHVDADAEGVGAADDPQHALLRELLDEPAVLRQHARVVHADAEPQQPRQGLAERGREAEAADHLRDAVAVLAGGDVRAGQRLRPLERGGLREVHDVDRRLVRRQQLVDRVVDRLDLVEEVQRHRPLDAGDRRGLAARAPAEVGGERRHVAERRRHQHELHVRERSAAAPATPSRATGSA